MQSVGVVAGGDEQGCGGVGTDAAMGQQSSAVRGDRVGDPADEVVDLFGELEDASRQQVQGVDRRAGDIVWGGGFQLRAATDEPGVSQARQRLAQGFSRLPRGRLSGWLMAWVRALTAEALANLNIRSISTGPSPALAVALARPLSTARAAAWASTGSVLP